VQRRTMPKNPPHSDSPSALPRNVERDRVIFQAKLIRHNSFNPFQGLTEFRNA
jgi:hypothetical protein